MSAERIWDQFVHFRHLHPIWQVVIDSASHLLPVTARLGDVVR